VPFFTFFALIVIVKENVPLLLSGALTAGRPAKSSFVDPFN
jgi:hypothetical protein